MNLPSDVLHFIVTTVLGFLSGIEAKSYRQQ